MASYSEEFNTTSIASCPACHSLYKNPRLLPCCHSICLECVEITNKGLSRCPKCQSVSDLSPDCLPHDATTERVASVQRTMDEMKEWSKVLCTECEQESKATHFCVTCSQPLCELDLKVHKKMYKETHKLVGIGELSSIEQLHNIDDVDHCKFHPNTTADQFCNTCGFILCRSCVSHHSTEHNMSGLEYAKRRVRDLSREYQAAFERLGNREYNGAQSFLDKVLTMTANIEVKFDELKRVLEERKKEVVGKLNAISKDTLSLLQKGECRREHIRDLIKKTREYESLPMDGQLLTDLGCINSKVKELLSGLPIRTKYSNIEYLMDQDVECTMKGLGCFRLKHTTEILPEKTIEANAPNSWYKNTPFSLTTDSRNNVYVFTEECEVVVMDRTGVVVRKFKPAKMPTRMTCGYIHWNRDLLYLVNGSKDSVTICNEEGALINTFGKEGKQMGELKTPLSIAVSNIDGDIYVLEEGNNRVQVFNSKYIHSRFIGYYIERPGQIKNPCELALTQTDEVVVVHRNIPSVNIYSSQGLLLRQFGSTSIGGQVLMHGAMCISHTGQLLLTDIYQDQIVVYDSDQLTLWTVGSSGRGRGQYSCPGGMICLEDGTVLVCDIGNKRIQIYNQKSLILGYN